MKWQGISTKAIIKNPATGVAAGSNSFYHHEAGVTPVSEFC